MPPGNQSPGSRRMVSILPWGQAKKKRRAAYLDLFATELDQQLLREIRVSAHGGYAIGSSRFREEIKNALKLRATPRSRGRQAGEARL